MTNANNLTAPRWLHVANGTSVTGTLEAAGVPGLRSIWADVLHEGPVPGGISDDELLEVRARHLAGDEPGTGAPEVAADLRRWRQIIADVSAYDELVLWYEHDLFDQLNLIQLLDRINASPAVRRRARLICIDRFPGHPRFKGLGELSTAELASLVDSRQPISEAAYDLATRAWAAFRSPDPRDLDALARGDTSALPFLGAALRRHLQEYPWTSDGLTRTERRLLTLAKDAPLDVWKAFPLMHVEETAFYISDGAFWQIVSELAASNPALVRIAASDSRPGGLPQGTIAVTDTGRAVLDGRSDRVATCGFDRWLGGVHLQGTRLAWRWDDGRGSIVSG